MAKKDPFEKFRQATLGGETESPLKAALEKDRSSSSSSDQRVPVRPVAEPENTEKPGKNSSRELVSFHLDREKKRLLGFLKFETGRSYGQLYSEAIDDLLRKYGKL